MGRLVAWFLVIGVLIATGWWKFVLLFGVVSTAVTVSWFLLSSGRDREKGKREDDLDRVMAGWSAHGNDAR